MPSKHCFSLITKDTSLHLFSQSAGVRDAWLAQIKGVFASRGKRVDSSAPKKKQTENAIGSVGSTATAAALIESGIATPEVGLGTNTVNTGPNITSTKSALATGTATPATPSNELNANNTSNIDRAVGVGSMSPPRAVIEKTVSPDPAPQQGNSQVDEIKESSTDIPQSSMNVEEISAAERLRLATLAAERAIAEGSPAGVITSNGSEGTKVSVSNPDTRSTTDTGPSLSTSSPLSPQAPVAQSNSEAQKRVNDYVASNHNALSPGTAKTSSSISPMSPPKISPSNALLQGRQYTRILESNGKSEKYDIFFYWKKDQHPLGSLYLNKGSTRSDADFEGMPLHYISDGKFIIIFSM